MTGWLWGRVVGVGGWVRYRVRALGWMCIKMQETVKLYMLMRHEPDGRV